jgi:cytochrome c oxidase subunit 1
MHITGTNGMPRRIYTYEAGMGWDVYNLISTIGSFAMAVGILVLVWNAITSVRSGAIAPNDPWDGASLEWAVPSPPPAHNFDTTPIVYSRRPLWDIKYPDLDAAHEIGTRAISRRERMEQEMAKMGEQLGEDHIHLPSQTYNPLTVAFGLLVAGFGAIYVATPFAFIASLIGLFIMGVGIVGWVRDSHKDSPYLVSH